MSDQMHNSWNKKEVINNIRTQGYHVAENYFSESELAEVKKSLLDTLHYIKPDSETDLKKKYYQIKEYSEKLKSHWYDITPFNCEIMKCMHKPEAIEMTKKYFNTDVIFLSRPAINAHDDANDKLLMGHQETAQMSVDHIFLWAPLYDAIKENGEGGLSIYKDSHKHGFFEHFLEDGKPRWTKDYTHVKSSVTDQFEQIDCDIKAGSAVFIISSMIHCGYPVTKKNGLRLTMSERFNPLLKLPFLRDENATIRMPYTGVDYNSIV